MGIKKLLIFIILSFFILNTKTASHADEYHKTIVIVLDELDFGLIQALSHEESSIGLMSIKTPGIYKGGNYESFFMTIATGRRIKAKEGSFEGIRKGKDNRLYIEGYNQIIEGVKENHPNFYEDITVFGECFKDQNIDISFIGSDSSALIAADKNGIIEYGEDFIDYDYNWLSNKTSSLLEFTDVLVLSYYIEGEPWKVELLDRYIENFSNHNIIVFPRNITGDVRVRFNTTLVPILLKGNNLGGTLTSNTTNRKGIVTNLDILPTITDSYGFNIDTDIGSSIEAIYHPDSLNLSINNLRRFINLGIFKYLFHGITIAAQLYIIYAFIKGKKLGTEKNIILLNIIISIVFVSLLLGLTNLNRYMLLYPIILMAISVGLGLYFKNHPRDFLGILSIGTNITMLIGIFLYPEIIYNSYIGYNNIIAAGRFYGFNNEAMGVLLATAIIGYFYICERIKNKDISNLILLGYIFINIIALSGQFGANFGGYLTSIALLLMMIYSIILKQKINKRTVLVLLAIGIGVFLTNFYIDIQSASSSHGGNLISRIAILGIGELTDMIIVKAKQLLFMAIIPPWSIIYIAQIYFIKTYYRRYNDLIKGIKVKRPEVVKEGFILFFTSIVAFFINDTGVIAFVYMNAYLITFIISLHNANKRTLL